MKRASFSLEHIFYPEASIKANFGYLRSHEETPPSEPQVKIFIGAEDKDNAFHMGLQFHIEAVSPADPYQIDVMVIGRFLGDPSMDPTEQAKIIVQSGPNILYGALRDYVVTLTSKSAWNEYLLPPVVFEPSDFDLGQPES